MMSSYRNAYASASEWLSALRQDEAWLSQRHRLETAACGVSMLRDEAVRRIGQGETFEFWEIYGHRVEPAVTEVWEIAELRLPKLKIQTIGMLSIEWLEQHTEAGLPNEEKPKKTVAKKKPKPVKASLDKPKTLKYYKHGNNGLLMKQRKRVDIVFRKWSEWKWIDAKTKADDFDALFEGVPRHCNITWTAGNTILTLLLQELLKQPYIEKQTKCSAKSLVEQQFGLTPNSDRNRLESDDEKKIKLTLFILDLRNPLFRPRRGDNDEEPDIQDAAMEAVYEGQLRVTKEV